MPGFSFGVLVGRGLAAVGLKSPARIRLRDRLHQFADFGFQKLIRNDQRLHRRARIAAARREGLIRSRIELLRVRLWSGRGTFGQRASLVLGGIGICS